MPFLVEIDGLKSTSLTFLFLSGVFLGGRSLMNKDLACLPFFADKTGLKAA